MRGAIIQSSFVPWRGFFHILNKVQIYVIYDSQQYTKSTWRNRNIFVYEGQPKLLTIPVVFSQMMPTPIFRVQTIDNSWIVKHLNIIKNYYREFLTTEGYQFVLENYEFSRELTSISKINEHWIRQIAKYLGIKVNIVRDDELPSSKDKTEKLLEICDKFGIKEYVSGISAQRYLDIKKCSNRSVSVFFEDYSQLEKINLAFEPSMLHWLITMNKKDIQNLI